MTRISLASEALLSLQGAPGDDSTTSSDTPATHSRHPSPQPSSLSTNSSPRSKRRQRHPSSNSTLVPPRLKSRHSQALVGLLFGCILFFSLVIAFENANIPDAESNREVLPKITTSTELSSPEAKQVACNPYERHGYLNPLTHLWIPLSTPPECLQKPHEHLSDRLSDLADPSKPLASYLSNKLVVFVGDSQDRNTLQSLCGLTKGVLVHVGFDGQVDPGRGLKNGNSRMCVIERPLHANNETERVFLVVVNLFHFGATVYRKEDLNEKINKHAFETDPVDTKSRVMALPSMLIKAASSSKLMEAISNATLPNGKSDTVPNMVLPPNLQSILSNPKPTLITLHSGMWDIAYLKSRLSTTSGTDTETKIPNPLTHWLNSASDTLLDSTRSIFPHSHRFWRTAPQVTSVSRSPELLSHLNEAGRHLAKLHGLEILDWERLVVGRLDWLEKDGFHQGKEGMEAHLQRILMEMERVEYEESKARK
ncbi:hypothetical protein HDV05_005074 [Chytridiales sp. JEL 0842]|nr:hypothetical protein HDV05_005074 [Chytridiales sp. JEL 0842]